MDVRTLDNIWPFFGLRIETPSLTLVYPSDDMIPSLVALADAGIHAPDQMPFASSWNYEEPAIRARSMAQFYWRTRSVVSPDDWTLGFGVIVDGNVVGFQGVSCKRYPKLRTATSGSWLGMAHHGRGIGTEMRRAILHLLFDGLGAETALTEAFEDNAASNRVTEKLGYELNGEGNELMGDGNIGRSVRYRMTRDTWLATRTDDIKIIGLDPCLPILGLA